MNQSITEKVALDRSRVLVIAIVGKAASDTWWQSPNRSFKMLSPTEQWQKDWNKVYNYLMHHALGEEGS